MKRIEYFAEISNLFSFRKACDKTGSEFVVYGCSRIDLSETKVEDKTEFEALQNHVHLLYKVKKNEVEQLIPIAKNLGGALLSSLAFQFPEKAFIVYVTITLNDSMIIRFHQKWKNEASYYNPSEFTSERELIFAFENQLLAL